MSVAESAYGRSAAAAGLKRLRDGEVADEIKAECLAGRKQAGKKKVRTGAQAAAVKAALAKDNIGKTNSQRAIAKRAKIALSAKTSSGLIPNARAPLRTLTKRLRSGRNRRKR